VALTGHADKVYDLRYASGTTLISGSHDKTVRVWNLAAGTSEVLVGHDGGVETVAVSPDGVVYSGATDGLVRAWRPATRESRTFRGHAAAIERVVVSGRGVAASASGDGTVRVWRAPTWSEDVLADHTRAVIFARAIGPWIATAGRDQSVRLWDKRNNGRVLGHHDALIHRLVTARDGRHLATAAWDMALSVWDVQLDVRLLHAQLTSRLYDLAIAPDANTAAAATADGVVHVWTIASGEHRQLSAASTQGTTIVRYVHGGADLLTGARNGSLRVWSLASDMSRVLRDHGAPIVGVAVGWHERRRGRRGRDSYVA
jgi:WD40 repeat protein